jgi:hypothetical protein
MIEVADAREVIEEDAVLLPEMDIEDVPVT